jgi:hypothetical protein
MTGQPEFWAVGLDVTRHYQIEDEDKPFVDKIIDVFIYNKNECTHCCELTPSYYLEYLETFVLFEGDVPDEVRERIDERYCHEPTEDCYAHTYFVDGLTKWHVKFPGEAENLEEARDYWSGNPPF